MSLCVPTVWIFSVSPSLAGELSGLHLSFGLIKLNNLNPLEELDQHTLLIIVN